MSETNIRINQSIGTITAKDNQVESTLVFGGWTTCLYPLSYSSEYRDSYPPAEGVDTQMGHRQHQSSLHDLLNLEKQSQRPVSGSCRIWQIAYGAREFSEGDEQPAVNLCYNRSIWNQKCTGLFPSSPCDGRGTFRQRAA